MGNVPIEYTMTTKGTSRKEVVRRYRKTKRAKNILEGILKKHVRRSIVMTNETDDTYHYFIKDFIGIIKEKIIESNEDVKANVVESDIVFNRGRLMAYHDIITTVMSQAPSFNISLEEIGLSDFNADKFVI